MTTYSVIEVIEYVVEAGDEDEAIQHVVDDEDRDQHCFRQVTDRQAVEVEEVRA